MNMPTDMVFMDSPEEIAEPAACLGTDALIIAKRFKDANEIAALKQKFSNSNSKSKQANSNSKQKNSNLKFKFCHIMEKMDSRELRKFEQHADFIAVRGASPALNKFAASTKRVDFLLAPFSDGRNVFDTAIARLCADSKTTVIFPFAPFLNAQPFARSMLFKNARFVAQLCDKFKVNCLFVSGAERAEEMRSARGRAGFATLLGFTPEQAARFTGGFAEEIFG